MFTHMVPFLAQNTVTENATLWASIVALLGVVGTLGGQWLMMKRARQDREQDRLDKEAEAILTQKYREGLIEKVDHSVATNLASVRASALAVKTSNGIKKDLIEKGVKLVTDQPIKAEIINLPENPVNTSQV